MISKEAMDLACARGAEAVLAHYGLSKSAAAPMGMGGTLQQGIQRATKAFGNSKRGFGGALDTGWKAMGAPAQNVVKGIGAGAGGMWLANQAFNARDQRGY